MSRRTSILDVIGKFDSPGFGSEVSGFWIGWHGGKLVEKVGVVLWRCRLGMRLILRHAIEDDNAVAQVDMVARDADQPLHQGEVLRFSVRVRAWVQHGLSKNHNVAPLWFAVVDQRHRSE